MRRLVMLAIMNPIIVLSAILSSQTHAATRDLIHKVSIRCLCNGEEIAFTMDLPVTVTSRLVISWSDGDLWRFSSFTCQEIRGGTPESLAITPVNLQALRNEINVRCQCQELEKLTRACCEELLDESLETYNKVRANAESDWFSVYEDLRRITELYRDVQSRTANAIVETVTGEAWAQLINKLPADVRIHIRALKGGKKLSDEDYLGALIEYTRAYLEGLGKDAASNVAYLARFYRLMKILVDTLSANGFDKMDVRPLTDYLLEDLRRAEKNTQKAWDLYNTARFAQEKWCPDFSHLTPRPPPYSPADLSGMKSEIKLLYFLSEGLHFDKVRKNLNQFWDEYEQYQRTEEWRQQNYLETAAQTLGSSISNVQQMAEPIKKLERLQQAEVQRLEEKVI